jgi:small-conductance mechanosensitive channel
MRLLLSLIVLYLTLPLLFSIFPFTLRLANTLFAWIMHPVKFIFSSVVAYIPNLFVILVIWFTLRYIVRGVKYLMNEIGEGKLRINGFYPDWAGATYNIIRFLLYAFGFVMMFPYLPGSDSDIFKGVSVFVGIIFSLGSSSAIGNIVAGMVITYMRPFKVGDHIKIGETTGDVLEKTPFVTRVKTHSKEVVTIPNSTILAASVVNYSTSAADKGVIFHVTITIGYDVPWRQVHQMMIQAAERSNYVQRDPAPFVLQTSLDDFYISYKLCVHSKKMFSARIMWRLCRRIIARRGMGMLLRFLRLSSTSLCGRRLAGSIFRYDSGFGRGDSVMMFEEPVEGTGRGESRLVGNLIN